jgi:hypothetical protein
MAALTKHRHVHSSDWPPIMNLYNYKLLSEIKTDAKNCLFNLLIDLVFPWEWCRGWFKKKH